MMEQLEVLRRSRDGLISRKNEVEEKRRLIKAETIRANRTSGVSKLQIASMRAQDVELLQEFNDLKLELGKINTQIKNINRENSGTVKRDLAQEFVVVAKTMMTADMYQDVLKIAKQKLERG